MPPSAAPECRSLAVPADQFPPQPRRADRPSRAARARTTRSGHGVLQSCSQAYAWVVYMSLSRM